MLTVFVQVAPFLLTPYVGILSLSFAFFMWQFCLTVSITCLSPLLAVVLVDIVSRSKACQRLPRRRDRARATYPAARTEFNRVAEIL